jgi:branched-subunit amino acid aminotransferase/4-amino-4-deoxychorismate lyase
MSLEDEKLEESDEVLLAGHDGAIFEGLSSNFFTIERDPVLGQARVVTAPLESVLPGTIQKLVLDYCLARNIPIEFKHPLISDLEAGRWMGAFITSTSRLVLPIEEVVDRRNLAFNRSHTLAEEPLVKEIREAVANNVQ